MNHQNKPKWLERLTAKDIKIIDEMSEPYRLAEEKEIQEENAAAVKEIARLNEIYPPRVMAAAEHLAATKKEYEEACRIVEKRGEAVNAALYRELHIKGEWDRLVREQEKRITPWDELLDFEHEIRNTFDEVRSKSAVVVHSRGGFNQLTEVSDPAHISSNRKAITDALAAIKDMLKRAEELKLSDMPRADVLAWIETARASIPRTFEYEPHDVAGGML